jgi:GT2 family glycosyltransferase
MLYPVKVIDIELSQGVSDVADLDRYYFIQGLVRLHGVPLGVVKAPVSNGGCTAATVSKQIFDHLSGAIANELLRRGLTASSHSGAFCVEDLVHLPAPASDAATPLVTVAVCTRDRPDDMKLCLDALLKLDYPNLDLLVVDNAPQTEATKELVAQYPTVRYVYEPRPRLDWARNRAVMEAQGEILAYTDDDVVVDPGWVRAIAQAFMTHSDVMALTGLVVPYELETEAQVLFEDYGGFGRGFQPKPYRVAPGGKLPWQWLGAGQFGTGANMAYRRSLFDEIGYFDPALDVGTVTNGGGDLEFFFRVLKAGHTLMYEPQAIIRHRHRRRYDQLKRQISFNGSLYALWYRIATAYPDEWLSCCIIGLWWMLYWNVRRTIIASLHQTQFPRDLILAEFRGAFAGLVAYPKARRRVDAIVAEQGWPMGEPFPIRCQPQESDVQPTGAIAVRTVELSQPLLPLTDVVQYGTVRVYAQWHGSPIGYVEVANQYQPLSSDRLARELVRHFGYSLFEPTAHADEAAIQARVNAAIAQAYHLSRAESRSPLPDAVPVSVVVATYDRPDDLRNCLQCLTRQTRSLEIVVVDNHPESGLTPPVVNDFPGVVLVTEARQGLAYARNAGFVASRGEILIATDDDVTMPPDWVEKLVAPFARADVMIVTGNVLPLELDTPYQQAFENYGGLGRGFEPREVDGAWYDLFPHKPSPTWSLGATANAAFRATMFNHPEMGLMDECLGPGMPSGVGEDTYLFYKALKAGYTLAYEPSAFVWHKHRRTEDALKRQLYGYSKGHVSYNLTTWLRDGDWRGLAQVLLGLPYAHYYRIKEYLLRRSDYPIGLIWLEIRGNLAGPWSLWRSRVRVQQEGRSGPFRPLSPESNSSTDATPASTTANV